MNLLEFAQRFLNYKAFIMIVNNQTGKVEFKGMFLDCPYRFCRFANVVSGEVDKDSNTLILYVNCNSPMYYEVKSHFLDAGE